MSLGPWSVFDARWAKLLVKLQRLFTVEELEATIAAEIEALQGSYRISGPG